MKIRKRVILVIQFVSWSGRVRTPTLMLMVKREVETRNFIPKTFWKIEGDFGVTQGGYRGAAQVPGVTDRKEAERFYDEAQARQVAEESLKLGVGVVADEQIGTASSTGRAVVPVLTST